MKQLPLQMQISLSVSEITRYLRGLLETDQILQDVWVQGEVSNLSRPSSGHIYFTLKDQTAALKVVVWKTSALHIRFPLQNGQLIEGHGYISLYERDGAYQLYADTLKPGGEGALYQEFMRLKSRLEGEGLFDPDRKRSLPAFPRVIGVVSSPTGAALQDILNTLTQRYRLAEIVIAPSAVQGEEAPGEIIRALRALNQKVKPDVIILARGGGSLEDLWAFNDEEVVRAIVSSPAPVITGVGHETDFTLADFASDYRAPTPTGAAVAATPDQNDLRTNLTGLTADLNAVFMAIIQNKRQESSQLQIDLQRMSPTYQVQNNRQRLDELTTRLERSGMQHLTLEKSHLDGLIKRLQALSPTAVLSRGYAIVTRADGKLVRRILDARPGNSLKVQVSDGQFDVEVK